MNALVLHGGVQPCLSPTLQAAILALGLVGSGSVALAGGCTASRNPAQSERLAVTTVLTDELVRRHGWQPGICRPVGAPEQQAEALPPENSSHAAALALEQIRAGKGH